MKYSRSGNKTRKNKKKTEKEDLKYATVLSTRKRKKSKKSKNKKPYHTLKTVDDLSLLQKRFVSEYPIDLNGTNAAIRAGYSPRSAHVSAHLLLRNKVVQKAITAQTKKIIKKLVSKTEDVIDRLMLKSTANMKDYVAYGADGTPYFIPLDQLSRRQASAIKAVTVDRRGGHVKLELYDALKADELLAKYHGLFIEKREVEVKLAPNIEVLITDEIGDDTPAIELVQQGGEYVPAT